GADRRQRGGRQVVRVGGRGVVLERLVVGDVIVLVAVVTGAADARADWGDGVAQGLVRCGGRGELALELVRDERTGGLGATGGGGVAGGGLEPALEPAPAQTLRVEQVTDVLAGQGRRVPGGAVVVVALGVLDEGVAAFAVADGVP